MRDNQPITQHEYALPGDVTLMSTTDAQSHITYANETFVQVSGYTLEELQGQPHNLVRHPDMPAECRHPAPGYRRHPPGGCSAALGRPGAG